MVRLAVLFSRADVRAADGKVGAGQQNPAVELIVAWPLRPKGRDRYDERSYRQSQRHACMPWGRIRRGQDHERQLFSFELASPYHRRSRGQDYGTTGLRWSFLWRLRLWS